MVLNNIIIGMNWHGILTDYRCFFDESGRFSKVFNLYNFYTTKDLFKQGTHVIITSDIEGYKHAKSRTGRWGVERIANTDKAKTLKNIQDTYGNDLEKIFVDNDPGDLDVIDVVNLFFAPADSCPEILSNDSKKIKKLRKLVE